MVVCSEMVVCKVPKSPNGALRASLRLSGGI